MALNTDFSSPYSCNPQRCFTAIAFSRVLYTVASNYTRGASCVTFRTFDIYTALHALSQTENDITYCLCRTLDTE